MNSFDYHSPTRLVFGKDVVEKLPDAIAPLGKKVLLAYGGGSIKRIGLYDKVKTLLHGFEIHELSGIEPNPKYNPSVLDGVRICKEQHIDVILAVGGGSVLDCCKAIAAGAKYDGDPWDLISYKVMAQDALPIVDIITLAATGSEYDCGGVISRTETNDKIGYLDPHLWPVCSFLDPAYTMTVNAKHTAAGVADAINHATEQFFVSPSNSVADGFILTIIKTLMKFGPVALQNPNDYEARSEIMLACTFGCNGLLNLGSGMSGWPMHGIEHALSAYYDITHGEGLAIIMPRWMRHILNERTLERFVKYGVGVFNIPADLPAHDIAEQTITCVHNFFKDTMHMPMTLGEVGIDGNRLHEIAHHIATNEGLDNPHIFAPLSEEDIYAILEASL
ncbi:MAG: iron-containing alcohol dehydrogenase [Prevotellaceae bacterium]|nr:iron-containing alcohol dehydrogenase [Prevotellaceae bacterium]